MPIWRPVPGFAGWELSDLGQVRNAKRGNILVQHVATRNLGLYVRIGKTTRLVHRLVLLTFVGPSKEKITWRNGNKRDNRLSNLCYGEKEHAKVGAKCSKGHDLVGENVATWKSNRICVACREGKPAVRELPEYI